MAEENAFSVYTISGITFFAFVSVPSEGGVSRRKTGEGRNPQESLSVAFRNGGLEIKDAEFSKDEKGKAFFKGKISGKEVAFYGTISLAV